MSIKKGLSVLCALLVGVLLFVSLSALSQDENGIQQADENLHLFSVPPNDRSLIYLSKLFGPMGNVLHAAPGNYGAANVFSRLFEEFNRGLLVVALLVLIYTSIFVLINTVQEGSIMGQRHNTVLAIIRIIFGFSLLVPRFNGYSFVQVFVMWAVVHGVGFADHAWNRVVNYLAKQGGQLYAGKQAEKRAKQATEPVVDSANQLMLAELCMSTMQRIANDPDFLKSVAGKLNIKGLRGKTFNLRRANELDAVQDAGSNQYTLYLGAPGKITVAGNEYPLYDICGEIEYSNIPEINGKDLNTNLPRSEIDPVLLRAVRYKRLAIRQIFLDLSGTADEIVSMGSSFIKGMAQSQQSVPRDLQGDVDYLKNRIVSSITNATKDFIDLTMPISNLAGKSNQKKVKKALKNSKKQGWIMAGAYYRELGKVQSSNKQNIDTVISINISPGIYNLSNLKKHIPPKIIHKFKPVINAAKSIERNIDQSVAHEVKEKLKKARGKAAISERAIDIQINKIVDNAMHHSGDLQDRLNNNKGQPNISAGGRSFKKGTPNVNTRRVKALSGRKKSDRGQQSKVRLVAEGGHAKVIHVKGKDNGQTDHDKFNPLTVIGSIPVALAYAAAALLHHLSKPGDIIMSAQNMGFTLIAVAFWGYIGLTLASAVLAVVAFICQSTQPFGPAFQSLEMWMIPIILAAFGTMLSVGIMFAVYIPLVPFLIFVFAAISWFVAVLEAMIAAPLVALGVTHPEGHDFLGKGEQAMMLILGVFLRPVLMIIGFIAGLVLLHIGMGYVNEGLSAYLVHSKILDYKNLAKTGGIDLLGLVVVYMSLFISVLNTCMSLIHKVPDQILRWLGQSPETSDVGQQMQEIKSAVSGASEKISSGMQQSSMPHHKYQPKGEGKGGDESGDKDSGKGGGEM